MAVAPQVVVQKVAVLSKRPSGLVAIGLAIWQILTDPTMLALLPHNRWTNLVKFVGLSFIVYRQTRTRPSGPPA